MTTVAHHDSSPRESIELKWADGKVVKDQIDAQILALLGPRTAEDQVRTCSWGSLSGGVCS